MEYMEYMFHISQRLLKYNMKSIKICFKGEGIKTHIK